MVTGFDRTSPQALLGEAIAAAPYFEPTGESVLRHLGQPMTLNFDLRVSEPPTEPTAHFEAVWESRMRPHRWAPHRTSIALREATADIGDLVRSLREMPEVGSVWLVDDLLPDKPRWRLPFRFGYLPDSMGSRIAARLSDGSQRSWVPTLVDFVEIGSEGGSELDLILLSDVEDIAQLDRRPGVQSTAVAVALPDVGDLALSDLRGFTRLTKSSVVLVPELRETEELARWFERFIEEISHRNPVDVAMAKSCPLGFTVAASDAYHSMSVVDSAQESLRAIRFEFPDAVGDDGRVLWDRFDADMYLDHYAPDGMFDSETHGATEIAELRRQLEGSIDELEPEGLRYLQMVVSAKGEIDVRDGFRAGETHTVHIWVGNGLVDSLPPANPSAHVQPVEAAALADRSDAEILIWQDRGDVQSKVIQIGDSGLSETASFDVDIAETQSEVRINIVLLVDGRGAMSGLLTGPVRSAMAAAVNFTQAIRFSSEPSTPIPNDRHGIAPALTIMEDPTGVHARANEWPTPRAERHFGHISTEKMQRTFDETIRRLENLQSSAAMNVGPDAELEVDRIAEIAETGSDAFLNLVGDWRIRDPARLRAYIDAPSIHVVQVGVYDAHVLCELFYDRHRPTHADWCAGLDVALKTGECPVCPSYADDPPPGPIPVCPAGFWGIRKGIERVVLDQGNSDERISVVVPAPFVGTKIRHLDQVLVAFANRIDPDDGVDPPPSRKMLDRIAERIGRAPALASDWWGWKHEVRDLPQVLVLLTHTTHAGELQLGADDDGDLLPAGSILAHHLGTPREATRPGPILLLLGCDTARTDAINTFVQRFWSNGAAVIVGTVGTTLGRFAAPIAGELVAAFLDENEPETVGELVTAVRRRSLMTGCATGLLLTVFTRGLYTLDRSGAHG